MQTLNIQALRQAFGTFMTGVTVVTAQSEAGQPVGFTAKSFTSVSLTPPLLLVCPSKSLSLFDVFNHCSHFAINILAEDQQTVSNTFASAKGDRFADISWQADRWGSPILSDVAAHFSCSVHQRVDAGDHLILIGEVLDYRSFERLGLGYSKDGYFSLGLERQVQELPEVETSETTIIGALIEQQGKLLLEWQADGWQLPTVQFSGKHSILHAMHLFLDAAGLDVALGPVYSVYESEDGATACIYYRAFAHDNSVPSKGQYIAIDELDRLDYASVPIRNMLLRYQTEWKRQHFSLYMGNVSARP